jgi:hypothetical protein
MARFMVLLTDDPSYWAKLAPEQMQEVIKQYVAWSMKMRATKRIKVGHKLADEGGKRMEQVRGRLKVSDGPFAESNEVVGGFYVLEADGYDHCLELLADHPHLAHGQKILVRAVDEMPARARKAAKARKARSKSA